MRVSTAWVAIGIGVLGVVVPTMARAQACDARVEARLAEERAAREFTARAIDAALARRGLTRLPLSMQILRDAGPGGVGAAGDEERAGDGSVVVVAGLMQGTAEPEPPGLVFAIDHDGAVFRIESRPVEPTSRATGEPAKSGTKRRGRRRGGATGPARGDASYVLCGCGPATGGAYMPRLVGYVIPKEHVYRGTQPLPHEAKVVRITWAGGGQCAGIPMAAPGNGPRPEQPGF